MRRKPQKKKVKAARSTLVVKWLKCPVKKGMFSDEAIIELENSEYIVPKDKTDLNPGRVIVYVMPAKSHGKVVALLPTEYAEQVLVDESLVVEK